MRVSIIIPTLGRNEPILLTVRTLLAQDYPAGEIILVDQSATHTEEVTAQLTAWENDKKIRWFRPPEITFVGTTKARNWGIAHASSPEIIIFTDDDVEVQPDFVQNHVNAYTDATVGAVAGKVIVPTHHYDQQAKVIGKITWMGNFVNNFHLDTPVDVDNLIGCNFSLRTAILKDTGLFDEQFRGNGMREETDWAVRAREAGYRMRYEPSTALLHHMVASGGSRAVEERTKWYEDLFYNNFLFYAKHAPAWRMPLFALGKLRPILACSFVYGKGRPSAIAAPWRGMRDGIRAARKSDQIVKNPQLRVF